jgi:hypothetical protein
MSKLESRVRALEDRAGVRSEYCQCGGLKTWVWWDEGEPEPEAKLCVKCGKPQDLVVIRWLWESDFGPDGKLLVLEDGCQGSSVLS